jgi:general L-amino acid transport system substrate-binding protein
LASSSPEPNAAEAIASYTPGVHRFAELEGGFVLMLGREDTWALRALRHAGNSAEICGRNPGVNSRRGIPHGLNQFWSMGVVHYAHAVTENMLPTSIYAQWLWHRPY